MCRFTADVSSDVHGCFFGLLRLAHRNHLPILIELRQCIRGHLGVGSH